jgi:5-formyltetrahydrofolate cyclo-ligase
LNVIDVKEGLRRDFLHKRLQLSPQEVAERSFNIQVRCLELEEFKGANRLALYASVNNEVVNDYVFHESLKKNKEVYFPRVDLLKKELVFCGVVSDDDFSPGLYNVLEPVNGENISVSLLDIIFVPGLVFDYHGNRLGYGKGYYDMVLSSVKGEKPIIGLAFDMQIIDEIPVSSHDVKMDKVVTEKRIIESK